MADKTLGIKVTDEVYDKAKAVIDMSGLTAKDWLEKAVALYELNSLKDGISGDYSNDLAELEVHTTRIYSLISNMIARSTYLKDHAVKEVADKLESKEGIITELQEQNKSLKASISSLEEQHKLDSENAVALEEKLVSMQNSLDNNQALINEYKEKNDTLNGLVTRYSGYAEDNERLKEEMSKAKAELTARALKAEKANEELAHKVSQAEERLQKTNDQHQTELSILTEKKDIERDKALVALERISQEQLTAANEKIRSLYDEIAQLRASHEEQINALKLEVEKAREQEKDSEEKNRKE